MNSCWIDFGPTKDGLYRVDISVGIKQQSFVGLNKKRSMLAAKYYILNEIQKFVNHRKQVIFKHGGFYSPEIAQSLKNLEAGFCGRPLKCKYEDLPRIILNYTPDLLMLVPSTKSKFFKSQSQLVFDLIAWAKYELNTSKNAA